jgi:arylsulfatase A-like enzyme
VVEELDWSVGQILDTLRSEQLAENTMVIFSSDNGPWLVYDDHGGSAGLLKDGKGSTWEGGMRVPGVFWWPGHIPAGVTQQSVASTMDILPTCAALCGAQKPDRVLDGIDLSNVLLRNEPVARDPFFYYRGSTLFACRVGPWKAHLKTQPGYGQKQSDDHAPPLLFNLEIDPSEKRSVADKHPEVILQIQDAIAKHIASVEPVQSQLEGVVPKKP